MILAEGRSGKCAQRRCSAAWTSPAEHFNVLLKGRVQLSRASRSGHDALVRVLAPGGVFGFTIGHAARISSLFAYAIAHAAFLAFVTVISMRWPSASNAASIWSSCEPCRRLTNNDQLAGDAA